MGAALSNQTRNRLVAPLSSIRVVEVEGWIAGSMLGMLLADQGADVIRIATPGTPIYDNPGAAMLARDKQSLVLNLAEDDDRDIALRLASSADIVIENLRPGALDGLGVGKKTLRGLNPGLVHIRLPGFASDDSAHADLAAYEPIIAASIGMYTELNLISSIFKMDPIYSALALPSIYGAVQRAIMCNAALLSRQKTGCNRELATQSAALVARTNRKRTSGKACF